MSDKQLNKFRQLWQQWHQTHDMATQALSSAVNIHGRLQDLSTDVDYPEISELHLQEKSSDPGLPPPARLQDLVVGKQLASMNNALAILRDHHEQLQLVVRDMERLYVEVSRGLGAGSTLKAAAAPQGPEPSLLQVVEAMQDAWAMCRDELLLKIAVTGLISLDATSQHMAVLLACYRDQPNIQRSSIDAVLGALQETRVSDIR